VKNLPAVGAFVSNKLDENHVADLNFDRRKSAESSGALDDGSRADRSITVSDSDVRPERVRR